MSMLARYLDLTRARKRLLHAALFWVVLSRIGLALVSLRALQRRFSNPSKQSFSAVPLDELRWAVLATARRVPGTRCLARALALQALMARSGYATQLCIGVAKEPDAALEGHAWVLHDGAPVIDEPDLARYTLLSTFPA